MRHVLCFGNPLHGDDGLGPAVAALLQSADLPADVRVFDVGTRGLDALPLLQGVDAALLIDAQAPAGQPGQFAVWPTARLLATPARGPHDAGLAYLLQAAAALGPLPTVGVWTLQAARVQAFEPGLSPAVQQALPGLLLRVRRWLDGAGCTEPGCAAEEAVDAA